MKILEFLKAQRRKILLSLLAVLVIMQFFPIDKTNPSFEESNDFMNIHQPPNDIALLLKDACYDCHSNMTKYPWYTNVAPVSWWIKGHIDHGRDNLNFSEWGTFKEGKKEHKLDECIEFVEDKRMPLLSYIIAHPEARLSAEQRSDMVAWFQSIQ